MMVADRTMELASYKTQQDEAMKQFRELDYIKNDMLGDYFFKQFKKGSDITYERLDSVKVGEPISLPVVQGGAIVTTRQASEEEGTVCYSTRWSSGSTLTYHYHSDCIQYLYIKKGTAKVYIEGQTMILTEGDYIEIAANVEHQTTSLEQSEMDMVFKKVPNVKLTRK